MKQEYMNAFQEIYIIFQLMPNNLLKKIPNKFYDMIETERNKDYEPNIKEPLEECKLMDETTILLGLIYRDFLCSVEERKRLQEKETKELKDVQNEIENEMSSKYNPEDIFKNRKNIEDEDNNNQEETSTAMIEVKEKNFLQKLFQKIKNLFIKKFK